MKLARYNWSIRPKFLTRGVRVVLFFECFAYNIQPRILGIMLRCYCPVCFVPRVSIPSMSPSCLLRRFRVPQLFLDRTTPRGAAFVVVWSIFRESTVSLSVAIVSATDTILVMPRSVARQSSSNGRSFLMVCVAPILVSVVVPEFPWSPLNRSTPRGVEFHDTRPSLWYLPHFTFPFASEGCSSRCALRNYQHYLSVPRPMARNSSRRCSFCFPVLLSSFPLCRPVSLPVVIASTTKTFFAVTRPTALNASRH